MTPLDLPSDYPRIKLVKSFDELITTRFGNGVNALCWPRALPGDFNEVVKFLGSSEGLTDLDKARLRDLPVSEAGRIAVEILMQDHRLLRDQGLAPVLNCFGGYPRDEDPQVIPTDVYSFHVDSATVETDTYLCTYHGSSSELLRNDQAQRRIEVPETRTQLLKLFGGEDSEEFDAFLHENCFDLHYVPRPGARPISFGLGNLWRIAVEYPGSPVPACIHRAPETMPGDPPRLLLIS